ncbi:hypothetical protein OKA05_28300 [Luteolibacter arcticus]|uniref:Uncharacterized protein n=1 Tax=Luteolibacter arcticus TaxID=1581411 RepID=A0ABT3GSM1_9BACT|nr:hypothetical protein [Luteolibacter arcticus]MCW1926486.1 hypothetical protein [Luteolibacter arcticus]
MKKTALLYLFAGLLLATPSYAQQPAPGGGGSEENQGDDDEKSKAEESDDHKRFWQASVPGGHYMVAIDRIASISMHEYLLDGQLVVNELVVDTNGRGLARFYHVVTVAENSASGTARRVVEKGSELLDRAGQKAGTDVHEMAQKNYPTTSHAGMIEYRILDLRDLNAIYKSVKNAWETGKGRKITLK